MVISQQVLDHCVRKDLDIIAPRTMSVIEPLLVILKNVPNDYVHNIEANLFPKDPTKGKQAYTLTKRIFIERADYQPEAPASYYGLTKSQMVLLKYAFWIKFESEVRNEKGELERLEVSLVTDKQENVPGVVHWIADGYCIKSEIRLYDKLFLAEDPRALGDKWMECLSSNSLKVASEALIWKQLKDVKHLDRFQFERKGYFAVDYDTDVAKGRYVFNLIVSLSESKDKKKTDQPKAA